MWPCTPKPPETISTDTVIPLHWNDDKFVIRAYILDFLLRFDDVLDPKVLCAALEKLMTMGDWRKLGARIRRNGAGHLEYHVPNSYTPERPGFSFSHVEHASSIEQHPLASRLPKVTRHLSVQSNAKDFAPLARSASTPIKLQDYLCADVPQLSLHIVSFTDATLVSLTLPHTFADAMGTSALFSAWAAVLNGREIEVLPLNGYAIDPLATLGSSPTEKFAARDKPLKGLNLAIFIARYAFELIWYNKEEGRVIFIPAALLSQIKRDTLSDISDEDKVPFLSDGDIITAWWSQLVLREMPWLWNRKICVFNALSWRNALSASLLPKGTAYVSNAVGAIHALFAGRELLNNSIAVTATAVRRAIIEQGTEKQVEAFAAIYKEGLPLFGDSSTFMFSFSNWKKANFYETDFSAAVVKEGIPVSERANKIGRPSYMHGIPQSVRYPSRNMFIIYGKDAEGNYWMGATLRAGILARLEESLEVF